MTEQILDRFRPQVAGWFRDVFTQPTEVQARSWQAISNGENALVVAPTGSGKTLAAFLWSLNSLVERAGQQALPVGSPSDGSGPGRSGGGVKVLYISPLKALGVDVENNLRAPLTGIARTAQRLGLDLPDVTVAVRSGDTSASERARQLRRPPDILITTPESAYLILTSKAAGILEDVDTVIVDEIHALAGTKRGVHLSLTLERLAKVAGEFQRIGLSATVRPLDTVAKFLGGDRPVEIIAPPAQKRWDLAVRVPVEDMADLPVPEQGSTIGEAVIGDPLGLAEPLEQDPAEGPSRTDTAESALPQQSSIWPFIEADLYDDVMAHSSTLIFVNSRRTAERLTSRLNEIWAQQNDPEALSAPLRRDPAQLMKSIDVAGKADAVIARAHHGSVSKDERAETERLLKEGALKAVVATSSLELGIDMGAIDLVVQVEAPPSVASGLQRVGRAGHEVGAVSHGIMYPKHRSDLVQSAVVVERMRAGAIEELKVPQNPLDVLVQQVVATVAAGDITADDLFDLARRAYAYRDLPREVFDSVIDLASGVYPSTDFSDLKPRVVYDRTTGLLSARPGAQRVAVTNAGTIPDRGMFGVFLVGSTEEGAGSGSPRRVGELDEEMVYESRVGDVFTLGASSWRIEHITRDQVQVTPAPGHTGRLPFWSGDGPGRPYELGKELGAFRRAAHAGTANTNDLDEKARTNLRQFLDEQAEATGVLPDEKTLVLERFRDELGDWRVVLHTPFGKGVNAAWALAVGHRVNETTGMDAQAVAGDDGIVIRLPEADREPDASLFVFDADDIEQIVTEQVGGSALFASRFRECAARALLLPRRNPGKRAPLWQQRQRAEQLLDVAKHYPSFPIILETVRECLRDVYDLPALTEVMQELSLRRIRVAEVTTDTPSPFASSLLFNYTGAFMYEGDTPAAEKRAAALALDPALLAKLLGTVELRDLLDPGIIAEVHDQLQWRHRARNPEEVADLLRIVGPVEAARIGEHTAFETTAAELLKILDGRIMSVRIGGRDHLAQVPDAPLLRDGLGVPVPPGVPAQTATITDALEQLISRWARTRGPFVLRELADAFGLGAGAAHTALRPLLDAGKIVEGRYRQGIDEPEYLASEVLKVIRSRSLAAARSQTRPVSQSAFARFLTGWQQVAAVDTRAELAGADGTFQAIEQLAGLRLPASAWETLILPARVGNYSPAHLDELTASGEVLVVGAGQAGSRDPWIMLLPADMAPFLLDTPEEPTLSMTQHAILERLSGGGAFPFPDLSRDLAATTDEVREALWGLIDAGLVALDSFAPVRARLAGGSSSGGRTAHRARRRPARSRVRMGRAGIPRQQIPPDMVGRFSLVDTPADDATERSLTRGESWLERYGVVTRGSVVAENVPGGFALAYKVLSEFEAAGKALRGYLIDGLGAAQFSTPAIIDRLRSYSDSPEVSGWPSGSQDPAVYVLAATDPANPYGASLAWPEKGPSRAAGALVVLIDGLLAAHLTRGGKTLRTFFDGLPDGLPVERDGLLAMVIAALQAAVAKNALSALVIEKIDGEAVLQSAKLDVMRRAGATITPRGVRISAKSAAPRVSRRGRSVSETIEKLADAEASRGLSFDD
ncbi:DEAD/DEAH box helicase [Corynebacterium yudongzhengii]|uniref:DEAD/DEAH box helicase n=1 Tax=Corynebacterium yudongzhengii TaxID=2080740 RepID=A0A2U1T7S1_9CORY|nr:DEAD/DEAH box helicase [Corynebacterium yudongzhengii]AWB82331.1 DEAD/DEAH box helicase [Corynebacterium yudongzhengii]PWC02051.1 DEAD/DEAH box helicase [Corynebacterium yudongzhengii]